MNSINRTAIFFIISSLAVSGMGLWYSGSSGFRHIPRLQQTDSGASMVSNLRLQESYGKLPLSFEPNMGQTDGQVKFLSRGNGYSLFLTPTEAVLALNQGKAKHPADSARFDPDRIRSPKQIEQTVVRMTMQGANSSAKFVGVEELPGKSNYFIGSDPKSWRANVPNYRSVKLEKVYPGIDLVYHGKQNRLEYDLIVFPGADPNQIKLAFEGAKDIKIDPDGNLILQTKSGDLYMHKPTVYQETAGVRRVIEASYILPPSSNGQSKNKENPAPIQVGFEVAAYDRTQSLVIDPVLSYSTYLGGSNFDQGNGVAVDGSANVYVTGDTNSTNFPVTPGAAQTSLGGFQNAFVAKLNPSGSALIYTTYLGGSTFNTLGFGIAVDSSGNAYVTGVTNSMNFPVTPGAAQTSFGGSSSTLVRGDAFVAKLNASGSALIYASYLGGSNDDQGFGIAVDGSGNAYVTGDTLSTNFPITPGAAQASLGGSQDAFVAKFNESGSALIYSTFLGGSAYDDGLGVAVDSSGNAFVTGWTQANNFPVTPGAAQGSKNGIQDAIVAKLNVSGSALLYSTHLGGSGYDAGYGVAVDGSGNAYVTGYTVSTNFPVTPGAAQMTSGGSNDAFVTKLNDSGSALVYSTYLGGSSQDQGAGIAVDGSGNAYVTGYTGSTNFSVTPGAVQMTSGGSNDAFATKLNDSGSALVYSTYLGGSSQDQGAGIAVDGSGIYVTGYTHSTNFPVTPGAPQTSLNGNYNDAFVAKIGEPHPPSADSLTPVNISTAPSIAQSFTAVYSDYYGYLNISKVSLIISGTSRTERVDYSPVTGRFTLMGAGSCYPGEAATHSNGYLTLNCAATSISGSGTTLTVTYNVTPQPSLSGFPYLLMTYVVDEQQASDSKTPGYWVVNRPPGVDSVSPMDSMGEAGMGQMFTAAYTDPDGWQNIAAANFYLSGNGGMHNEWLHYLVAPNLFTMMGTNDVCSPGQMKMLTNGYLTLDCSSSSISGSGTVLAVIFQVTPQMSSSGIMYDIFAAASDQADAAFGAFGGTWMIQ